MTPQEAVTRFYELLLRHFHHGHEQAQLDRAYQQVCEELNAPVARPAPAAVSIASATQASEIRYTHYDEDVIEQSFWEFDERRKKSGEERLAFKDKLRWFGSYAANLRSPEPVLVSLHKCGKALARIAGNETEWASWLEEAAAVLDAAGVRYVD